MPLRQPTTCAGLVRMDTMDKKLVELNILFMKISTPRPILAIIFMGIGVVFCYRAYQCYQLDEKLDWSRAGTVTIVTFFGLLLFLKGLK